MASILILSKRGEGIPLGHRLTSEGHIVKFWFEDGAQLMQGFQNPSRVGDPRKMLDQYDLILADQPGLGELCEELRAKGKRVHCGGVFNDQLSFNQSYQRKVAASLLQRTIFEPTAPGLCFWLSSWSQRTSR